LTLNGCLPMGGPTECPSSTEMQQLFFKEVVAPPSVISFETFIGSLEHGSIISSRKENDSEQ